MWNPFKKKPFLEIPGPGRTETITISKKMQREILKKKPEWNGSSGKEIIHGFPKLCRSELETLGVCIDCQLVAPQSTILLGSKKSTVMKRLVDKGYLVRIKPGQFKLAFYK